jgi:hypothetical protein
VPADHQPGPLIGAGRAADVFALGSDRVLRRYRAGHSAEPEAAVMTYLAQAGFPVPRVYDASGPDLVLERLTGPDTLADLVARPWLVRRQPRPWPGCTTSCTPSPRRRRCGWRSRRATAYSTWTCIRPT